MAGAQPAHALLGGFEVADGYTGPFTRDFWSYDAGQTGALFAPAQYNTGRWKELVGNSAANSGAQYVSQHGFIGSASLPPFAMAVRSITQAPGIDYDMTVQYDVGADDTGVAPGTLLQSASITFDICPGRTVVNTGGFDTVFNDVPAFSLSLGGTDASPGATIGFTDHDPGNSNRSEIFYNDGSTYNSQPIAWTSRFDQITVNIDFVTQTFDLLWTPDANLSTVEFDAGNPTTVVVSGAALTSPINTLDQMYFRAHTDPSSGGGVLGGLEKSYLDNFQFTVKPVPEPASLALLSAGGLMMLRRRKGQ
jgi:hypothetical protein